jgi:hypothetical protein
MTCPPCAAPTADGSRFCPMCGTPLAAAPLAGMLASRPGGWTAFEAKGAVRPASRAGDWLAGSGLPGDRPRAVPVDRG